MDLLEFSQCELYFDEPMPAEADALLTLASQAYGEAQAESLLLRAYFVAPEHLSVLVGLYRYYFYQHRLADALIVADRAMAISATRLRLPDDWRALNTLHLGDAAQRSFGLLRFYLLALKASAVVLLRSGQVEESRARLKKLVELDSTDRLGANRLLEVIDEYLPEVNFPATPPANMAQFVSEAQHG
jgi:hypothetical protein